MKGLLFSALAGCIMVSLYPQLMAYHRLQRGTNSTGDVDAICSAGAIWRGVLGSNVVVNTIFMRAGKLTYGDYFRGSARLHLIGVLGGVIWMIALCFNVIASGVAGLVISVWAGTRGDFDRGNLGSAGVEGIGEWT